MRPQTIQIFLPAGDPRGMRVAEITTRIVRVIEVPRSQLSDFLKMPEAQQVGVYFLMGELGSDPNARPVSRVVRHRRGHQGRALQPGEWKHRLAALHLRATASRLPRDPLVCRWRG